MKIIDIIFKNSLIAMLTLFLISSTAIAQVSLDFGGDLSGRTGDAFTLDVQADLDDNEIDNFDFEFEYDTTQIAIDSITAGPLITGPFEANEPDMGRYILATYGNGSGITGNTVLFTVHGMFKSSDVNESGIQFTEINVGNNLSTDASTPFDITTTSSDTIFELPDIEADNYQSLEVEISTDDLSSLDIGSYQFKMNYDADALQINDVMTSGTVSENGQASFNADNGVLSVAWAGSSNIGEGGVLLKMDIKILGEIEGSPVQFSDIQFFNDNGDVVPVTGVGSELTSNLATISMKTARGLENDSKIMISGIVTSNDFGFSVNNFYIQDETAGMATVGFDFPANNDSEGTVFEPGQELTLIGERDTFRDQVQIVIDSYEIISEGNTLPEPILITSTDQWTVDSEYQGMRVTLENMYLPENADWPEDAIDSGAGLTTELVGNLDTTADTFLVFIDRGESYFDGSERPQGDFNMTGVMGRFYDDVQLYPFFQDELGIATTIEPPVTETPSEFQLKQNYPNPFNPTTQITYNIPEASNVTLEVYNALGQKVSTLVNNRMPMGSHTVTFNAENLTSGVYFARIQAGNFVTTKKMLLLK
ncbi:cohesin domain-containing protein [Gracilimonas sp.]|uniref:cohesin domain-containing protein n=1 Tax=Gracilimonas sp. TaxID=1974203 RepID=UPI002870E3F3|nr:cohesin domain-containing protein [Gracilimonas sp.]